MQKRCPPAALLISIGGLCRIQVRIPETILGQYTAPAENTAGHTGKGNQ